MHGWTLRARESFWFLPAVFGVAAIVIAEALVTVDRAFSDQIGALPFFEQTSADGARSIATTIGTSMLTVAGTSFSITISVLATTSSTYGPRLVRNFMADRSNQFVLAMFTSTFLYSLLVGRSVRTATEGRAEFVPTLGIHVAVLLAVVDVAVLVYLIHHIASSVQITTLQKRVQLDLIHALDHSHPERPSRCDTIATDVPARVTHPVRAARDGYVQRVDLDAVLRLATAHDFVAEIVAMPGVYVLQGDPLLRIDGRLTEGLAVRLRNTVTIGVARTPEQDVRFALQQLTEVSIRGLASGSNDPYTSVSALELVQAALVPLVRRGPAQQGCLDEDGRLRVIVRWPSTEELLTAVFDSVRQYGTAHPAVLRTAIDLAERIAAATTSTSIRQVLSRDVEELLTAWQETRPDRPDQEAISERAVAVLARLNEPGPPRKQSSATERHSALTPHVPDRC